jgi:hypothetical protein
MFRGPVLAVMGELLVLVGTDWVDEDRRDVDRSPGVVRQVGRIERRGRRRHAVIADDIAEAVNV